MWNNFGVAKEQAKQEYLTLLEDLLSSTNEKIVKTTE
jgi:acyl-CoA-binding protein